MPAHRVLSSARTLAGLLAAGAIALAPIAAHAQELNDEIRAAMGRAKLGAKSKIGVSIVDADRGTVLASLRASDTFLPASNLKVLTSGAALFTLGPDFTFKTEILRDGDRIIVKGDGDPALADPELLAKMSPRLTVADAMKRLADAVAADGVRRISELVVDDRIFDRDFIHPTWPQNQLNRWYCAEVSGLNFHTNVLAVFPRPSPDGVGKPPPFTVQPDAPWITIENRARTSGTGQNTTWLARQPEPDRYQMFGEVRFAAQVPVYVTIHDPALFFGRVFADSLAAAGVDHAGSFRVRTPEPAERFPDAKTIALVKTPLDEALARCNKDSHNLYADALFKRVGHQVTKEPGSWSNGNAVVRMLISEKLGPDFAAAFNAADGSGLSRDNQVTPLLITRWLSLIASDPSIDDHFIDSLPTNGEGTLEQRFRAARLKNTLRAKSGAINGVRCLSGYVISPNGRRLAFSILCNNLEGEANYNSMRFHEEVVKIIDAHLARLDPAPKGAAKEAAAR